MSYEIPTLIGSLVDRVIEWEIGEEHHIEIDGDGIRCEWFTTRKIKEQQEMNERSRYQCPCTRIPHRPRKNRLIRLHPELSTNRYL